MGEYIDKEAVLSKCDDIWNAADETTQTGVDTINTIDEITDFIESLPAADVQPVNQWTSVEDRLPESEKEVLVWYKYTWDAGFTSYGFGINRWCSNAKQWREGCLLKGVEVLYWQPLPEPPKDGDTNE